MKVCKKFSAVIAAAMCFSVISLYSPVFASEAESGTSVISQGYATKANSYSRAASAVGIKFDKSMANVADKCAKKTNRKKLAYSDSLTKKFFDKLNKRLEDIENGDSKAVKNGYILAFANAESIRMSAMKGEKSITVNAVKNDEEDYGAAYYLDESTLTKADFFTKKKQVKKINNDTYEKYRKSMAFELNGAFYKHSNGSVIKIKYKKKSYTLEFFEYRGETMGFIFDSKENVIGGYDSSGYLTVKFSLAPKDSVFVVPTYFNA